MNTIWQTMTTAAAVRAAAKIPQACETSVITPIENVHSSPHP